MLSVALTPDGHWVLSGSKDRGVQFWNPRTGDTQLMLQGHKNSGTLQCIRGPAPQKIKSIGVFKRVIELRTAGIGKIIRGRDGNIQTEHSSLSFNVSTTKDPR